ncbi:MULTISPECIES: HAD family hydrolase [Luteimonas]|uniref:HAD family hydrolase n=1 Tax=Luteimonas TaxID=83614 RepID=UPI000C79D26A|nr:MULTISPECIES: HAD family phosphatase [Luteimonas]
MSAAPPLPQRPAAVLFDMDGLLLDSERVILECLQTAATGQGIDIAPDWWLQMIGQTDAVCRALLGARIGPAAADALLDDGHARYIAIAEAGVPHRPGVVALLALLARHDVPRAVATSTRTPLAQRKLGAAGLLPYFDVVCTSSDVARPKPAPDVYLLAAARLGIAPAQCLVLEDSPTGVRAALAAGMTVIQVPDLVEPDDGVRALGHRIVGSLDEARALLAPWWEAGGDRTLL